MNCTNVTVLYHVGKHVVEALWWLFDAATVGCASFLAETLKRPKVFSAGVFEFRQEDMSICYCAGKLSCYLLFIRDFPAIRFA